jgi:hypothetical protein
MRAAFGTHGESKVTLPLVTLPPETAVAIPFEAPCKIYTGRTAVGSGGTLFFQGRRTDNSGTASGSGASQEIVIEDAWYDLRQLTLQAAWANITGYSGTTPIFGTTYTWPDCVLFQESLNGQLQPNGSFATYSPLPVYYHITTGQSIYEILAYAICFGGVNLQIGTIDPACYVPFYPVRSMRCAEAIKIALRVHPDCTSEIDYTTTPPTFNIRQRSNLTSVTLPYKSASGNQIHLTSQVQPRPELIPTRVGIYIKSTATVNNQPVVSIGTDIYPAVSSGLRSLDVSVDMTGPKLSKTQATLTTAAFNPASLTWWASKVPALQSTAYGGQIPASGAGALALLSTAINPGSGTPKGIQVIDDSGNPINLTTYGYELLKGTPASWMTVSVIEANVIGFFTYNKNTTSGGTTLVDVVAEHMHTVRVKLCSVATSTFNLSQTLSTGEVYPTGLAQAVYNSLSTLQYNFTHTIQESPFATLIKPGKHCLNLSGGATAWSTMNAMVQGVDIVFSFNPANGVTTAKTTVKCGPVEHLDIGELIQIFNLFTNRDLSKINPSERLAGTDMSGGQVTLGNDGPKENSVPLPQVNAVSNVAGLDTVSGNTNVMRLDGTTGRVTVAQSDPVLGTNFITGTIAPVYSGGGAPLVGLLTASNNGAWFHVGDLYVDASGNALWRCVTEGGYQANSWSQISAAASGGLQQFKIVSDDGDYWVCNTWDGTTQGVVNYNVVKPYKLRAGGNAIGSETIRTVTYTYSYTGVYNSGSSGPYAYFTRGVSGSDGSSETDYMTPDPVTSDIIYAMPVSTNICSGIPTTVASVALVSAGSGYSVNQVLTLATGTGTKGTIKVLTVSGGAIATFQLLTGGNYTANPTLTACGVTTGSATFNVTMAAQFLDINADGRAWSK